MALQVTVTQCSQLRWTSVGPWVFCYCSVITTDIDRLFLEIFRTMWHCCDTQTPDQGLTSLVWIDKVLLNLCGVLHVVWAAYFSRTTHFFNALLRNDWQVESCKYLIIQLSEVGVTVYLWDNYQNQGHRYIHLLPVFPPAPLIIVITFVCTWYKHLT